MDQLTMHFITYVLQDQQLIINFVSERITSCLILMDSLDDNNCSQNVKTVEELFSNSSLNITLFLENRLSLVPSN